MQEGTKPTTKIKMNNAGSFFMSEIKNVLKSPKRSCFVLFYFQTGQSVLKAIKICHAQADLRVSAQVPYVKVAPEDILKVHFPRFTTLDLRPTNTDISLAVAGLLTFFNSTTTCLICAQADCKYSVSVACYTCGDGSHAKTRNICELFARAANRGRAYHLGRNASRSGTPENFSPR